MRCSLRKTTAELPSCLFSTAMAKRRRSMSVARPSFPMESARSAARCSRASLSGCNSMAARNSARAGSGLPFSKYFSARSISLETSAMAASDFMTQCGRVHVTLAAKNDEKGECTPEHAHIDNSPFIRQADPGVPSRRFLRMLGRILEWKERPEMALTKRQRQIYDFIADFVRENGYSPSFEEIGAGLGLSSLATVHKHINNLEAKKLLRRDYNRSRSIDVLPLPPELPVRARAFSPDSFELPLLGRIAAGRPIEQMETP